MSFLGLLRDMATMMFEGSKTEDMYDKALSFGVLDILLNSSASMVFL